MNCLLFLSPSALPGDQRAVLHHALLDEDALGGVRLHHAAVLVPQHLHVLGHEGGLALEGQAVPLEDHLPLGRSQLEGGQLQRSICRGKPDIKRKCRLICIIFNTNYAARKQCFLFCFGGCELLSLAGRAKSAPCIS